MRLKILFTGAFGVAMLAAPVGAQSTPTAQKQTATKQAATKQASPKQAATAKARPTQTAASRAPAVASKSAATKSTSAKTAPKTTAAKSAPPPRRVYQQQPTTDRYRDIQQALADRGFFKGPVDGAWGSDSAEALKRFQREQKLDDDGKISSLSIIALGLGPHREIASNAVVSSTPAPNLPAAPASSSSPAESARTAAGPR